MLYNTHSWFITGEEGQGSPPGWVDCGKWSKKESVHKRGYICLNDIRNVGVFDIPHIASTTYTFDSIVFFSCTASLQQKIIPLHVIFMSFS